MAVNLTPSLAAGLGAAPTDKAHLRAWLDAIVTAINSDLDPRAVPIYASRDAAVANAPSLPASLPHIAVREGTALVIRSRTAFADDPLFPTGARWGVVQRQDVAAEAKARADAIRDTGVLPLANVAGTANAITADLSAALVGITLSTLSKIDLPVAADNTDAVTLNVADLGAWPVHTRGGADLQPADLKAGRSYQLRRRGNTWRMINAADSEIDAKVGAVDSRSTPIYGARDVAVTQALGLPAAVGRMLVIEGDDLVVRSRTASADDPLFTAGDRWGVVYRASTGGLAAALDDEVSARALADQAEAAARVSAVADLQAELGYLRDQIAALQASAPVVAIGAIEIGSDGAAGSIYEGYVLRDGDDFDTAPAFFTPTAHDGSYMTTRHYGVQSTAPRYLRGAASLGGYEADPWHTGFADAGRGVAPASFADTIKVEGSALKLKSRRATPAEKALMGPLAAKNNLSSMVHMGRRNMMRAPCIAEMRLRFPYALTGWNQWHPTFWLIQSQPGNGWDGLELDCEGFAAELSFNRNTWNAGIGKYGPTLGKTKAVSKTEFRTYGFEVREVNGAWRVRLWEDGVLVAEGSPDYGGNVFDPTRPFHLLMTNHILQSGLTQSIFDAAGDAGADMECDWWRVWGPAFGVFRKPRRGGMQLMADFDAPFSFALPAASAVWGQDVVDDVIEMIPNEDNSPAQPWVRGLLPPSVTRTGDTLSGRISDHPGRLVLARSATPAKGDGCVPQPVTICVGPTVRTTSIGYRVGQPFSFDVYAAVDCGDLHMGKEVTTSGWPAWATFDAATGLVTGVPTDTGSGDIIIAGTNAVGQSVSRNIPLRRAAAYELWTGPGWFDFSDSATITAEAGNLKAVANKRPGGVALVREGATAIIPVASGLNGRAVARFARSTTNPARLAPSNAGMDPISVICQGEDKPYTVISVYVPRDANTGFVWSWSDTLSQGNAHQIALIRRAATPSSVRREHSALVNNDVTWGAGQEAGAPRIVAVVHTGTSVSVWDTSLTKVVNGALQDTAIFNNELAFRIGAAEAGGNSDPLFAATACEMDVCEIVIEGTARSDADVRQAISDIAGKWGITLL